MKGDETPNPFLVFGITPLDASENAYKLSLKGKDFASFGCETRPITTSQFHKSVSYHFHTFFGSSISPLLQHYMSRCNGEKNGIFTLVCEEIFPKRCCFIPVLQHMTLFTDV